MSKAPSFNFYYRDYAHGTRFFSFEEKGAYVELMCEQADNGHLDLKTIMIILGDYCHLWERISCKFEKDSNGLWYNERLDVELKKRKDYVESRKKNLNSAHMRNHMESHMAIANAIAIENINSLNKGTKKVLSYPELEEVKEYFESMNFPKEEAESFFNHYTSQGWIKANGLPVSKTGWKATAQIWHKNQIKRNLEEKEKKNDKSSNGSYQSRLSYKPNLSNKEQRIKELKELGFD